MLIMWKNFLTDCNFKGIVRIAVILFLPARV